MKLRDIGAIGFIVVATVVAGYFVLSTTPKQPEPSHHGHGHGGHGHGGHGHAGHDHGNGHGHGGQGHSHDDPSRGAHGGRIFEKENFSIEVSIFEKGVPPRFRVYAFKDKEPVDPREVQLTIELKRLGDRVTEFTFKPKGEYLYSEAVVEKPHSFEATVLARYREREYRWQYSQVEARVRLGQDMAQALGIDVETAGPAEIDSILVLPGVVALNADMVCHVVPRVSGSISQSLKNLGDSVKAGEVIAVLDSRELADAKSRYLVHLKREELASINYNRLKKLWEKKVAPEKDFLDAQKAFEETKIERFAAAQKLRALGLSKADLEYLRENPEKPLTNYELRAPFDGVVITKHMSRGEWVDEQADIMSLADLSKVWVDITVYADNLDSVQVGQKVTVKSDSTDLKASGTISYVGPLVGEETRTAKARVVIDNPDGKWRPGMFVTARLTQRAGTVPVAVSEDAIQSTERFGPVVFVRYGDQFEVRPIVQGRKDASHVEILKGLLAGEKYASEGSFIIKSELEREGIAHTH